MTQILKKTPRKAATRKAVKSGDLSPKRTSANSAAREQTSAAIREKQSPRKTNRRWAKASESVMVVLDNPGGIRWVMDFAPIYAYILRGIETALRELGKRMQVCSFRSDVELKNLIKQRPPDGLLVMASSHADSWREIIDGIPCVAVLGSPCEGLYDRVTYDGSMTGKLPAEYFLEKGIRRVAILGGKESGANATFNIRHRVFVDTMRDHGGEVLELLSSDLYEPGNPSNQPLSPQVASLVAKIAQATAKPEGLFVMADNLLPLVYSHLRECGILPGTPLDVVSCNAERPYLAGLEPEPATVEIPAEEIGRRAVDILSWRQQNPSRLTALTVLPPALRPPAYGH